MYGLIPTLTWESVKDSSEINHLLDGVSILSDEILVEFNPRQFHPRNAEVLVQLEPSASKFEIYVNYTKNEINIAGKWSTIAIANGDLFIGEPYRAERIYANRSLSDGDYIFLILEELPREVPNYFGVYSMGPWHVLAFEFNEAIRPFIFSHSREQTVDENFFHTDILDPGYTDPRPGSPIPGLSGSKCMIAILPPNNLDPEFEIIPLPLDREKLILVPPKGAGLPRFIKLPFPQIGSKRFNIHWGGRHRLIHLHTVDELAYRKLSFEHAESRIGLFFPVDARLVTPWGAEQSITIKVTREGGVIDSMEFVGPKGMSVELEGQFSEDAEMSGFVLMKDVLLTEVISRLNDWIYEGCQEVLINFDGLGQITLKLNLPSIWARNYGFEEIVTAIDAIDTLPSKASWQVVREALGIPLGTNHNKIRSGTKKKIRRAILRLRRRNHSD